MQLAVTVSLCRLFHVLTKIALTALSSEIAYMAYRISKNQLVYFYFAVRTMARMAMAAI